MYIKFYYKHEEYFILAFYKPQRSFMSLCYEQFHSQIKSRDSLAGFKNLGKDAYVNSSVKFNSLSNLDFKHSKIRCLETKIDISSLVRSEKKISEPWKNEVFKLRRCKMGIAQSFILAFNIYAHMQVEEFMNYLSILFINLMKNYVCSMDI